MNGVIKLSWTDYLSIINYFSSKASLNDKPIGLLLSEALKNYADKLPSIPDLRRKRFFLFHSKNTNELLIEEPYYSSIRKRFGLRQEEMEGALDSLVASYMGLPPFQRDCFIGSDKNGQLLMDLAH